MRLYLDDDCASGVLARLLRADGHDVELPRDAGLAGVQDAVHLTHAICQERACLTKNYDDFFILHTLIMQAVGNHFGIVVIRQENNPTRDMSPKGITAALRKLETTGVPIAREYVILNHWR